MKFDSFLFALTNMKAYVLDGSLYGRQILFNLADMDINNMEFILVLDMTNIDIAKLDDPNPKKKTRDAELSLNANFSGKGFDVKKELNINGYINVYKIGEGFAREMMKGLNKEKGESKEEKKEPWNCILKAGTLP